MPAQLQCLRSRAGEPWSVPIPLRYWYRLLYLVQFWDVYDGADGIRVSMTRSQKLQVAVIYPGWNGME